VLLVWLFLFYCFSDTIIFIIFKQINMTLLTTHDNETFWKVDGKFWIFHLFMTQQLIQSQLKHCRCWQFCNIIISIYIILRDKLNVFEVRCLRSILGVWWQDHISNDTIWSKCSVNLSLAHFVWFQRLGRTGNVLQHNDIIDHDVMFSTVNTKRCGCHCSLW